MPGNGQDIVPSSHVISLSRSIRPVAVRHLKHISPLIYRSNMTQYYGITLYNLLWFGPVPYSDIRHTKAHPWWGYIDGLVQQIRNSSALATELRLSCTNPSIWSASVISMCDIYSASVNDLLYCKTYRVIFKLDYIVSDLRFIIDRKSAIFK